MGRGFDEAFCFNNGHWNNYFDPVLLRGSWPEQTKGYITDVFTDEAMKFLTANQADPFFWIAIEVATPGDYDIKLAIARPSSDAGSRLRISAGTASFETIIPEAPAPEIP